MESCASTSVLSFRKSHGWTHSCLDGLHVPEAPAGVAVMLSTDHRALREVVVPAPEPGLQTLAVHSSACSTRFQLEPRGGGSQLQPRKDKSRAARRKDSGGFAVQRIFKHPFF